MDCLVDIDKLIDELEDNETDKTNINHKSEKNGTLPEQQQQQSKNNIGTVFSGLKEYVGAANRQSDGEPIEKEDSWNNKEVEISHRKSSKKKPNEITIRKFSNPNYAYNDNYTSSDDDDLEEDIAKNQTLNNNCIDSSTTTSSDRTSITSGQDSLSTSNSENEAFDVKVVVKNNPQEVKNSIPEEPVEPISDLHDPMSVSITQSNELLDCRVSSISSMVELTSNYKNLQSDCRENSTINHNLERDIASITSDFMIGGLVTTDLDSVHESSQKIEEAKENNQRKPVGFESTMDDVSDTELESYLQELEYEIQATGLDQLSQEKIQKVSDIDNEDDGDNLSKASTIEFNELKLLKDPEEEAVVHEYKAIEPIMIEVIEGPKVQESETPQVHIDTNMFQSIDSIRFVDSSVNDNNREAILIDENCVDQTPQQIKEIESHETPSGSTQPDNNLECFQNTDEVKTDIEQNHTEEVQESEEIEIRNDTSEPKNQRPNSLDIIPTISPIVVNESELVSGEVASPGNTPPPTATERIPTENEGMTSSSSEDFSGGATSTTNLSSADGLVAEQLGKIAPHWVPDNMTNNCMQCDQKFSLIKRRHHCRACGQLLCSSCCCFKAKLEYLGNAEARICIQCDHILSNCDDELPLENPSIRQPNPNNPMEYCSVIPPHQQVSQSSSAPISVMVPIGVLKREGQPRGNRKDKNVIFSDGIRPGCDLTELDNNWDVKQPSEGSLRRSKNRVQTPPGTNLNQKQFKINTKLPPMDEENRSYIPKKENSLPPIYSQTKTEFKFSDITNDATLITRLHTETLKFAVQRNFYILVKIIKLKCCVNKTVINFTTKGLHHVGQDEIIVLLELDESNLIPKDIFLHLNDIYNDADKGNTITELGFSMPKAANFLGSKEHGGFLFIRPSFQCLQNIIVPKCPFLIGVLIHRWEVPWAKIFPLRLMLRLGALFRYYPTPHISVRNRDSVYAEIAQTIINFLADFRTYSYTLPTIRGMVIHMEDRKTSVQIPRNRYDQVVKAVNNSSDHILAIAGNFSKTADGHLVCIQNTEANSPEQLHSYSTQAINIQGQPRKVTGASFIVLNGALKTSSGLSGKCNIVEDGLMVQILPAKMVAIRDALKNMKDIDIVCGPFDADPSLTETVTFKWTDNDLNFNIGVNSPIDKKDLSGIPSIRCHNSLLFSNANHAIRWTEVFIIKSDDDSAHGRDPVDIPRLSEQIARGTCQALVALLNLLAANNLVKIGLRVTLDPENVCYEAGSQHAKLAPLYMNALDNELIGTLHQQANNLHIDTPIILELIFCILDK